MKLSPRPNAANSLLSRTITTPDARTVVFTLGAPYAPLLASLASGWGAILPSGLIESGHNFGAEPVGTGPFKFTKWVRDNKISMVKNENYWIKGLPKLAGVDFNIVPERFGPNPRLAFRSYRSRRIRRSRKIFPS